MKLPERTAFIRINPTHPPAQIHPLNTHHHDDHTGGNANFGAKDATIIAQSNVRKRLACDAKVIPGHGKLGTVEDLKTFHAILVETTGPREEDIAAGKSLERK